MTVYSCLIELPAKWGLDTYHPRNHQLNSPLSLKESMSRDRPNSAKKKLKNAEKNICSYHMLHTYYLLVLSLYISIYVDITHQS